MTVDEMTKALAERDARIAALESEILRLRPAAPLATLEGAYVAPDLAATARLIDIVLTRYPVLRPKACDHERFIRSVRVATQFLGTCFRLPNGKLDDQYRERWRDRCTQWITAQGLSADISPATFYIAVIAAGDIDYHDPGLIGNGVATYFGLRDGGTGRRARNEWLKILEANRVLREPLAPPRVYADWKPAVRLNMPQSNARFLPGPVETI
jgi:hypothetical protein